VTYANGVCGAFTYDDKAIIRDNPRIQTPRRFAEIFETSYFGGPRGSGSAYRPMLLLSYAIQWWVFDGRPAAFHIGNILFHIAATLLLASFLLRLEFSPPVALAAALLFAVHPIHVESVTSLVGRGETQTAAFVLSYLLLAQRVGERGTRWRWSLVAASLCYGLALFTKESGVVAPAMAALMFMYLTEGSFCRRVWIALRKGWPLYLASALVLVGFFFARIEILGGALRSPGSGIFEVENALAPLRVTTRVANACLILWRYLGRSLVPLHLSADESAWSIRVFRARSILPIAASLLLLLTAALAAWRALRRRDPVAFGFLFFLVSFLSTANLLFPIGTIFAERIAYLPSAGICLILGALVAAPSDSLGGLSRGRAGVLAALVLAFAARAVVRNAVWWSDERLFANSLATSPRSAKAEYNVAYIRSVNRDWAAARSHYVRAIEIYSDYWDAWAGKGRVEKELGRLVEAEHSYEKSIEANAAYENGYFGLGQAREARGRAREALEAYQTGLRHCPQSIPLAYRQALLSEKLGLPGTGHAWRLVFVLGADSSEVRTEYVRWLAETGRDTEAVAELRSVLRHDPSYLPAIRLLAERAERQNLFLSEALAREKAFRLSRSVEDREKLERVAREDANYRSRLELLKLPPPSRSPAATSRKPSK
jgi:tetratricopeptide (TPR) repeat protein